MELPVIIGLVFLGIFLVGFYFLIFPVWLLIHCAQSKISSGAKMGWLIFMLLTWPLGSFIFGLVSPGGLFRRLFSGACIAFAICFALLLLVLFPKMQEIEALAMQKTREQLDRIEMPGTLPVAKGTIQAAMKTLEGEVDEAWFAQFEQAEIAQNLHGILREMIKDDELSPSEYQSWIGKFRVRHLLDKEALDEFIEELRESGSLERE